MIANILSEQWLHPSNYNFWSSEAGGVTALVWNWYEIEEGTAVGIVFLLLPILWGMRHHAKKATAQRERHHAENLAEHKATREAVSR